MCPRISIVVPVYGCAQCLEELYLRIMQVMDPLEPDFELILVDDRGPDRPWEIISDLARKDPRVRGLRLSRNFGQHFAVSAGIDFCSGEWLVVMDCDLQDRPEEIAGFWQKAAEGFDVVVGRRTQRRDRWSRRLSSWMFHRLWGIMTDQESDAAQGNFGLYSGKVIRELKRLPEKARVFPLLVRWLGFETAVVDIEHAERTRGRSGYTWSKMFSLAADGIISYSNKPLKLFIALGFAISGLSFFFGVWIVLRYFFLPGYTLVGWSSIMVSVYFLAGILLSGLGVLGVYIGRIFDQVKDRPLYVISEIAGREEEKEK